MKKANLILSCLIMASLSTSIVGCSSDDSYPAPLVSITSSTSGTIDLSDGTIFSLPVNITSEGGIRSVVVKDSEGHEWLNQSTFEDPKSITKLDLDLSSCTETKALLLDITVTDNAGQETKSTTPYSLSVYVPKLYVSVSPSTTVSDKATVSFYIGRGVKSLSKAVIKKDGADIATLDLTDKANDKSIFASMEVAGMTDGKNDLTLDIYENAATAAAITEKISINRINLDRVKETVWFKISDVDDQSKLQVRRLSSGEIDFLKFTPPAEYSDDWSTGKESYKEWDFTYKDGNVTKIIESYYTFTWDQNNDDYGTENTEVTATYEFAYNSNKQLTGVTKDGAAYVTDVVYENGLMTSYVISGVKYEPSYNDNVRVDILDKDLKRNKFDFKGTETMNPYFISGLPAVIPGDVLGIPLQLVYSQYLFESAGSVWNAGWEQKTDEDGDLNFTTSFKYENKDYNLGFNISKEKAKN